MMHDGIALRHLAVSLVVLLGAGPALAESLSPQDRDEINRLRAAHGHSQEDVAPLLDQVNKAGEKGLPVDSLANKVKEGLAKGVEPKRIDPVLRQMTSRLESAHEVLEEAKGRGISEGNRQRALETMAEALARGATVDEVRELSRLSQDGRHKATQEELAAGAKGLAVMKEGRIPSKDGTALVGEGIKQGYRASELLDLSREVKRRGSDFEEGRASIKALREQVRQGERSDRLFKDDDRSGSGSGGERDRGSRSDRGGSSGGGDRDRGDRGGRGDADRERVDRPDRSGHGDRPDRVERPEKLDRSERPDHSGSGRDH
ncbi:MAG: hypothetical protein U0236_18715 [Nitrospira sp.]